ncbi:13730_t:CDS:2 [Funneliformis mosseae]|uniref:13730_t:CDS:1 n=1 Tax=Funneliformis mosseae TaxID=27381 RepID=A0A9N8ZWY0_FUNMO|nr:13730_t:CDS:2 [Funneliformis mosseae]
MVKASDDNVEPISNQLLKDWEQGSNLLATENPNISKIPTNEPPSLLAAQHTTIIIGFSHLLIEVAFQVILIEGYHFRQDFSFLEFVLI